MTSWYYPPTVDVRDATDRAVDEGQITECGDCGAPYGVGGRHRCPMSETDWWGAGYRDARAGRLDPPDMNGQPEFQKYMEGREAAGFDTHSKGM